MLPGVLVVAGYLLVVGGVVERAAWNTALVGLLLRLPGRHLWSQSRVGAIGPVAPMEVVG